MTWYYTILAGGFFPDDLVTLIIIQKVSLCAKPLPIVRNLHHQIKQTKNGGVSIDGVVSMVRNCNHIDSRMTTDAFRCILVFCTRRKIDKVQTPSLVFLSTSARILSVSVTNAITFG